MARIPPAFRAHDAFYEELTSRNRHFVSASTQAALRRFTILVAGCGSTGGACIEALARLGVERFVLADNGSYELANLNRQHARVGALETNKAVFHRRELEAINPFVACSVETGGVRVEAVARLCEGVNLVFDAVDVTTKEGIAAKLELHVEAHRRGLPVLSALDLGLRQWGMAFDYRDRRRQVLYGAHERASRARHPMAALFAIYPTSSIPDHCLAMIWDLVDGRVPYASQLGCASDLLSAIVVPVVLRLVETGELVDGWNVDLAELRDPAGRATELSNDEAKELRRRLNVWLAAQDSATRPR